MAFKYATANEQEKTLQSAEKLALQWLEKGYTPKQVAKGIWNQTGHLTDVRNGWVIIRGSNRTALVYL